MRRTIALLAVAAVAGLGVLLLLRDEGSGLDLEAISSCEQPRVHEPVPHEEVSYDVDLAVEPVTDLEETTSMDRWPDGRLVVGLRTGQVVLLGDDGATEEILDLADRIELTIEGGLIGLAVDPSGSHVYVHHTDLEGTSHVLSYEIDDGALLPGTERDLIQQPHPGQVHNGGNLVFGPDGMLYLGFGDGSIKISAALDSDRRDTLAAKILRIDPTPDAAEPYAIPPDNPDPEGERGRPEIWLEGLRNPWRFSFDRATGELWIGDVGNDCWEEINVVREGEADLDFGWPRYEGDHALASDEDDGASAWPLHTRRHGDECALIGGTVYRGEAVPELDGVYLFLDLCEGELRGLERSDRGTIGGMVGLGFTYPVATWADEDGEVHVLTAQDGIFRVVPAATN